MEPWIRTLRQSLAVLAISLGLSSCTHLPPPPPDGALTVSLPDIPLGKKESIQSVHLDIFCGRVVSINRWPYDWFIDSRWDSGDRLIVGFHAGHFSSGLKRTLPLNELITVRAEESALKGLLNSSSSQPAEELFNITAKILIEEAGPGDIRERKVTLSRRQLLLRPAR